MRSAMGAKVGISEDGAHTSLFQEVLKVREHTKQHSLLCFIQPSHQACRAQGRAIPKKCIFRPHLKQFGRGTDKDRAVSLCGFWKGQVKC